MSQVGWALSWFRGMVRAVRLGRFTAGAMDGFIDAAKRKGVTDEQIQEILLAELPTRGGTSNRPMSDLRGDG
jgi:hypothetical protein